LTVGVVVAACGSAKTVPAGAVIIAIDSDVSLPKDIDTVRLEVLQGGPGGTLIWGNNYSVPMDQHLPATLAVQAGSDNNTIDVRVIGVHGSEVKVLREAVTTVPTDRQVTLRMPVAWLCYGSAMQTAGGAVQSTCPSGQTCVAGECKTNLVQSQTLAVYKAADIFGGAPAPGNMGTCFDTVACFGQGFVPQVDMTHCTVPLPKGSQINFGLVTSAGQGVGICGTDSCYIPLDNSPEGWSIVQGTTTVQLPPVVCDRLTKGNVLSVVATTTCETKDPSIPTCGAWSSVQSMPGTTDASAPEGAIPVEAGPVVVEAAPEAEAAVADVSVEAPPGPLISCPNIWTGIDTAACDPRNPYVGCQAGNACAIVSANAVGCVPSNLSAIDAGTGMQGYPCGTSYGCADGTICNSKTKCGIFCCNNADCAATGFSGLLCHYYQVVVDAGADGAAGDAATPGTYGVCE
jgi:hypothetical protein